MRIRRLTISAGLIVLISGYQNCAKESGFTDDSSTTTTAQSTSPTPTPTPDPGAAYKSCTGPKGETIAHGEMSETYYTTEAVGCRQTCGQGKLKCEDGTLVGDAKYTTCDVKACDVRTVSAATVENMQAAKPYLVSVYGISAAKGDGNFTLNPVVIKTCQAPETVLATTKPADIDWPDGNAPQSATLAVTAPANGCIKATTDNGDALNVTVSEHAKAAKNIDGNEATGLKADQLYSVSVYGITANRGSDGSTPTLNSVRITNCAATPTQLAATAAPPINWHDGSAPHSATLNVKAPADGCIRAFTDIGAALNITVHEDIIKAMNVTGNEVTNLTAKKKYKIDVYGVTTNRGQDGATLTSVRVVACTGGAILAQSTAPAINWHDGSAPHSASLIIEAPTDGCVRGLTDGGNALNLSVEEL